VIEQKKWMRLYGVVGVVARLMNVAGIISLHSANGTH
jgi:hypothetical protein